MMRNPSSHKVQSLDYARNYLLGLICVFKFQIFSSIKSQYFRNSLLIMKIIFKLDIDTMSIVKFLFQDW